MIGGIIYTSNRSSRTEIESHLKEIDFYFVPHLSSYVDIDDYSTKLFKKSLRIEAYLEGKLIGLVCYYLIENNFCFLSNFSIIPNFHNKGISKKLFGLYLEECFKNGSKKIILEVNSRNKKAINFYKKIGFSLIKKNKELLTMELNVSPRDYNEEFKDTEDHKYAYNFDLDVIHPYMIKSFQPFFKGEEVLELGSFKGDFTKRLLPYFTHITCVEASNEAIDMAKSSIKNPEGKKIQYFNSTFEDVSLPKKYSNIILTHVLEHIDNPVDLLRKIKNEWLEEGGKLFLACPNGNAPSRQIAVKMGLISHNTAITPAEKSHGHRITYTLDTLEKEVKESGLNVLFRTGIFFKALSNFQWDELIKTNIITKEYLDGCYQLGQHYPDLCSSIVIVCEK
jgi:2-polyprenyl-3-methyl-5-hydroxy-6-metoxy-1,4-benzoquinol methylase